jgi:hypothetical protein
VLGKINKKGKRMDWSTLNSQTRTITCVVALAFLVVGCDALGPKTEEEGRRVAKPVPVEPQLLPDPIPVSEPTQPAEPEVAEAPVVPRLDTMADVPGDKALPPASGRLERFDCKKGKEDLHARMAFEARGGRVVNFAYYSKWKPRTCAFDFARTTPGTKWRVTAEGDTRVHTPEGRFLIRTLKNAYVFEFEQVQRGRYCGMPGTINGSMTIKRVGKRECSVKGIMDTNDPYLDSLYMGRLQLN